MALTPIALIPQVVLGGLMVPVTTNPHLGFFMKLMPARWGFEGVIVAERQAVAQQEAWNVSLPGAVDSPPDFISGGTFQCAIAQMQSTRFTGAWGFGSSYEARFWPPVVLLAMTVALLTFVVMMLQRQR